MSGGPARSDQQTENPTSEDRCRSRAAPISRRPDHRIRPPWKLSATAPGVRTDNRTAGDGSWQARRSFPRARAASDEAPAPVPQTLCVSEVQVGGGAVVILVLKPGCRQDRRSHGPAHVSPLLLALVHWQKCKIIAGPRHHHGVDDACNIEVAEVAAAL